MQKRLHDSYCSQNTIRLVKSRGKRWAKHVTRTKKKSAYIILVRILEEKDQTEPMAWTGFMYVREARKCSVPMNTAMNLWVP